VSGFLENETAARAPYPLSMSKFRKNPKVEKNLRVPPSKFRVGGRDPHRGGPGPKRTGALYRDHKVAHSGERTVAISVAVTEKIEFEKKLFSAL